MPFYKRENEEIQVAPTFVSGPGFVLNVENKNEYKYPVEGWYWFETLDEAMRFFSTPQDSVTMRQARLALLDAGLLQVVEGTIAQMPEPQKSAALIEWEYAGTVERTHPLLAQVLPAMGVTETDIEALFQKARML